MKYIITATNAENKIRTTNEVPELETAIRLFHTNLFSGLYPNVMLCDNETGEVLMHTRQDDDTPWVADYIIDDVLGVMLEDEPELTMECVAKALFEELFSE
jgi:hypothetical protein